MKKALIFFIKIYQKTLSPDHGYFKNRFPYGFCRFYPTCSEYSKIAIQTHGSIKGLGLSVIRIIHCNPWANPKVDTVSNK